MRGLDETVPCRRGSEKEVARGKREGELCLIHTFAFESGNLCARRSETECNGASSRETDEQLRERSERIEGAREKEEQTPLL